MYFFHYFAIVYGLGDDGDFCVFDGEADVERIKAGLKLLETTERIGLQIHRNPQVRSVFVM